MQCRLTRIAPGRAASSERNSQVSRAFTTGHKLTGSDDLTKLNSLNRFDRSVGSGRALSEGQ
jgi:hypothetical protein